MNQLINLNKKIIMINKFYIKVNYPEYPEIRTENKTTLVNMLNSHQIQNLQNCNTNN